MAMTVLPGHGLVFDGQDTDRGELLEQARAWLVGGGTHPLDADDILADRRRLVLRAWWGGDEVGFVQEDHPQAQPVTIVNIQVGG